MTPGTAPRAASPQAGDRLGLAVLAAVYLGGTLLLVLLSPPTVNPDATAYLNIAQHYLDGDFSEAVVSHWAPLYSWVVAVPMAIGVEPEIAGPLTQLVAGVTVLAACWMLLERLSVRGWVRTLTALAIVPLLARWTYYPMGPDLALAGIYLWLLVLLTSPRWPAGSSRLLTATGLLIGLAYLAKGTSALALTLAATLVAFGFRFRGERGPRRTYIRDLSLVALVAALLVVPWAVAISIDVERPTLGTSAAYSAAVVGPEREGAHPTTADGFLAPPHPKAVSAWEDPERLDVEPWTPVDDPVYAMKRFVKNVARFGALGLESIPLAGILALVALVTAVRDRRSLVLLLAGFALLIALLYSPILTQERYAWASYLLVVILAGTAVMSLLSGGSIGPRLAVALLAAVVLSNLGLAVRDLQANWLGIGEGEQRLADSLSDRGVTNVAANAEWHESLAASYRAGDRFFGVPREHQSPDSITRELDDLRIDGFLQWETEGRSPAYLSDFARGETGSVDGRRVTLYLRR